MNLADISSRHRPDRPDGYQSCVTCMEAVPHDSPERVKWPCDAELMHRHAEALFAALEHVAGCHSCGSDIDAEVEKRHRDGILCEIRPAEVGYHLVGFDD